METARTTSHLQVIRIGEYETGWVKEFIRFPWANPNTLPGNGAEFVTVDSKDNLYGGEPVPNPHTCSPDSVSPRKCSSAFLCPESEQSRIGKTHIGAVYGPIGISMCPLIEKRLLRLQL